MLRVEVVEVSGLPHRSSCPCAVEATCKGVAILETATETSKDGVCGFKQHFFLPVPQSIEFCIVAVLPDQASPVEAHCVVGQETLVGLSRVVSAIRRFPLKSEGSSSLVLKLRLDLHGSLDEGAPDLKDASFEGRYERLTQTLSAVVITPPSSSAKKSPGLPRVSSMSGRRVLSSHPRPSDGDCVVAAPMEGSVAEIHVHVGHPLFYGTLIASISKENVVTEQEPELFHGIPTIGPMYSGVEGTVYETSNLYERPANLVEEELTRTPRSATVPVLWEEKEPGIVTQIKASVGSAVVPGSSLIVASMSHKSQHIALLTAADRLAFQTKNDSMSANARFQSVTERLVSMTANGFQAESDDIISCCGELEQLARDFLDTARTYGRVIISEMHLPIEYKTIRPLKLGGVLGGQKYVVRGILFKIPDGSMFSKYPDPMHIANKVQGHELKGLKAYFGWFFNRGNVGLVSFPLIALIDYKGHRITAMTQLPIQGKSSLIYGSADAGQDCIVANEIPAWSQFIREASLGLNLKPHFVVNGRSNGGECEMVSCVDLEGHKGSDQRFYLLDFSRTFPPVFKAEENRRQFDQLWPFYHMFRPEFVATWSLPLCADACSNFQSVITGARKEEATRNNKEIRSATEHLMTQTMAHVCKSLLSAVDKSISLTHVFHRKGLNMRYLGLVYSHLVSDALYSKTRHNLYRLVQAEALMRVLKNHLRTRLRSVQEDSVVLREAVMGLNFFFGFSSNAAKWVERNPFVLERLVQDFYFSEGHAKGAIDTFLSDATVHEVSAAGQQSGNSIKYVVLTRLNAAIGLGIRNDVLLELQKGSKRSFARSVIFEDADLSFQESVKHLDVVERARGLAQFLKASRAKDSSSAEKLLVAFETVEKALEASPLDSWLSLLMGDICNALWNVLMRENVLRESKLSENEKQDPRFVKALADELVVANLFCDRANVYYNQAIAGDQPLSYRNYGMFCLARKLTNEAEDAFLKALEACSRHGKPLDEVSLIELVSLLVHKGNGALANSLREKTKSWCHFRDTWLNVSSATDLSASTSFRMGGGRSNTLTSTSPPTLPARPRREALQSSQPAVVVKRAVRQVRSFGNMLKRRSPKGPQEKLERRASGEFDSSFDSDRESGIESGIATDEEGKEHEELRSSLQQNLALLLQQSGTDDDEQEEGLPHSPRPIELSVTQSLERNKLIMTKLGK